MTNKQIKAIEKLGFYETLEEGIFNKKSFGRPQNKDKLIITSEGIGYVVNQKESLVPIDLVIKIGKILDDK